MNLKLKAFSVVELLIAMILSSIVILIAYTMYSFTVQESMNVKLITGETLKLNTFFEILQNDFDRSESITGDKSMINLSSIPNQEISYIFNDKYTVRCVELVCDTFKMTFSTINITYMQETELPEKLIEGMEMSVANNSGSYDLSFLKSYTAFQSIKFKGAFK